MKNFQQVFAIFLFLFVITFILYLPVQHSKFVCDTTYAFNTINNKGISGIWYSYSMPPFIWYIPSLLLFTLYKCFGFHWLGWHFAFCILHSLNGCLLYILLNKIVAGIPKYVLLLSVLLFVISPFQSEVLAWAILSHYLLIVFFLLSSLIALLSFYESKKMKYLIRFHFFFLCSLTCFEQALLFPLLYAFFIWLIIPNSTKQDDRQYFLIYFYKIASVHVLAIACYFILTKITYGKWIAHYGSSVVTDFSIMNLYNHFLDYQLKFLCYYRYLPNVIKQFYNLPFNHKLVMYFSIIVWFSLFVLVILKRYYQRASIKIILFLCVSYVLMLIPVLNLDNSFTFEIQSDRYGYVASVFFYPLLILVLYKLVRRNIFFGLVSLQLLVCLFLSIQAVKTWHNSGNLALSLIKNYPLPFDKNVYLLNLPDNYKGAYTFRNCFQEYLTAYHQKKYTGNIDEIAGVNVFSNENETSVEILNDTMYYVKCLKIGKWYYHNAGGATDYETQQYKVDFDEWNFAYQLTIKNKPKDTTYILQCDGNKWKTIDTLIP